MNKCRGCGAVLQTEDRMKDGYVKSLDHSFCERCFRIQHYNDYQKVEKKIEDFAPILKEIGDTNSLVILVVDVLSIPQDFSFLNSSLHQNPLLLVLTKRDLLPSSLYEERLKNYFQDISPNIVDTIMISSSRNYHLDELMEKISKYQTSSSVYVIGYTNAGKSTLINKIIENYTEKSPEITTSMLPNTTMEKIEIVISNQLTLIDTPGFLNTGNLIELVDGDEIKRIYPKKEIRPLSYQIKERQSIFIDKYARIDCETENNLVFYISNQLEVKRSWKTCEEESSFTKREITVHSKEDVVINGLGFFKVMKPGNFIVYVYPGVEVYTRKSFI